ncbi:Cobyrinic acid ac-diamide synthase [Solidesulfovibrio fructosivorans JJ]]|uniref:Cobyrinic acid ac-diamide synthase n=1 Tax=Solidesulfovibrio fructosivorans JJ] TaxID=596151 RepID=E1K1Y9_SOLFR|nr:ATP-binding protein [Solidesulfovibrio fructosivorans]EFL49395.1 Cobyrinic acid ac-diamide synthase [Solidesulfovibrio fructosivorans JJ]]
MRVSIASGKGGTGKTTVSAALASVWTEAVGTPVVAVDCDVEEPNLHLFLRPLITDTHIANIEIPVIDVELCTRCGACREICQFAAITILGDTPVVFDEMCHGCGACAAVCPFGAIGAGARELGRIEEGAAGAITFLNGRLRVGEAMSPALIRAVLARLEEVLAARETGPAPDVICDAPPGVSCPAGAAVSRSDAIVLVTEPTPFGIHDFRLAVEAFSPFGGPMAVVINRAGPPEDEIEDICREAKLPILARIPDDRTVAEAYARGKLLPEVSPDYRELTLKLAKDVARLAPEARHA